MSSQKRIIRELTHTYPDLIQKHNIEYSLVITNEDSNNQINQLGLVNRHDNLEVIFNLSKDYPFKYPILEIENSKTRNITYHKWLSQIINNHTDDQLLLAYIFTIINLPISHSYFNNIPNKNECLCCSSITCGNQWCPRLNFFDLTIEYLSRKKMKMFLTPLMQRYISKIFDNELWSLNNDLIFYILDFVKE